MKKPEVNVSSLAPEERDHVGERQHVGVQPAVLAALPALGFGSDGAAEVQGWAASGRL